MSPDFNAMILRDQLIQRGLARYVEPMMTIYFARCLDEIFEDWTEERVIQVMTTFLDSNALDQEKDVVRPWTLGHRPDLEKYRQYSKSWGNGYQGERYGLKVTHSVGLNRKGEVAERFFVNGRRTTQRIFETLMCDNSPCPKLQSVVNSIKSSDSQETKASKPKPKFQLNETLMKEKIVHYRGEAHFGRPAKIVQWFECKAHGPIKGYKDGWDLFDLDGRFVTTIS